VHEVVHQRLELLLGFDVELELVLSSHPVAVGKPVQGHQDDGDPDCGLDAEDEVEKHEGVGVPVAQKAEGVQNHPEQHQADLSEHEYPTADQPREIGGDAVREREVAVDLAVQVADRRVIVLVLDQVPGDVFDFSAD